MNILENVLFLASHNFRLIFYHYHLTDYHLTDLHLTLSFSTDKKCKPAETRRRLNVYKTSIRRRQLRIDVL